MELDEAFALEKVLIRTVNSQIVFNGNLKFRDILRQYHQSFSHANGNNFGLSRKLKKNKKKTYNTIISNYISGQQKFKKKLLKPCLKKNTDKTVQFELALQINVLPVLKF